MKKYFITATDTDAGKTFVSCSLVHALSTLHINPLNEKTTVAVFKPIAAGCDLIEGKLINEDAKLLCEFANCKQSIEQINPIAFEQPIAPHIAANRQSKTIRVKDIISHFNKVKLLNADFTLVEGAGGWRLPLGVLNEKSHPENNKLRYQFLSDFVKEEKLKVILVVNMKLGCLNHALLTYETIKADGLDCVAWIANSASKESMQNLEENIIELENILPMPNIAKLNFIESIDEQGNSVSYQNKISLAASKINLVPLLASLE
jgi:dethiobiotin synthetase